MEDYEASTKNKTVIIHSHSLMDEADNMNYLRISAIQADNSSCTKSVYFYGINNSVATTREVLANGTSASFEIPENL